MYEFERATPRFDFNVTARIRRLDELGSAEHTVTTANLSVGGMYFLSEIQLAVHTPVRAFLVMPHQLFGEPTLRWRCEGRVVHVRLSGPPGNRLGVGISFHTYTVLTGGRLGPESIDERSRLSMRY